MTIFHRAAFSALILFSLCAVSARAAIYHGFPHLHLMVAVVAAGGGFKHFEARQLVTALAGSDADAENASLVKRFGTERVDSFYRVFTYAVNDATKKAHNMLIPIPKSGQPDPADGPAVAAALYGAGTPPGKRFDVGYMLEAIMSHQIHHNIMGDMDRTFTPAANADFHVILTAVMHDLSRLPASKT